MQIQCCRSRRSGVGKLALSFKMLTDEKRNFNHSKILVIGKCPCQICQIRFRYKANCHQVNCLIYIRVLKMKKNKPLNTNSSQEKQVEIFKKN